MQSEKPEICSANERKERNILQKQTIFFVLGTNLSCGRSSGANSEMTTFQFFS